MTSVDPTPPPPAADVAAGRPNWSFSARLTYRLAACYFAIFFLPTRLLWPLDMMTAGWIGVPPDLMSPGPSGSGDKALDWVHALSVVALALMATVAWSVLDRKRREYVTALAWTRLALRYLLASVILGYGLAKVFPMQFQPPTYARLEERFGDFSPMGVLWSFMGASMGYTIFAGALEVLGAVLLLFRQTALAGALVTAVVMTNVFALNMFYDVPVKLYSFHWLLLAVVIAAPDLGRLFRFVVTQQPTSPPSPAGPVFASRRLRILGWLGKAAVLVVLVAEGRTLYRQYTAQSTGHALTGTYRVDGFPAWQRVVVENAAYRPLLRVTRDDGTAATYAIEVYEREFRVRVGGSSNPVGSLTFGMAGQDVTLEGDLLGAPARMRWVRVPSDFLLLQSGFHWVTEVPINH